MEDEREDIQEQPLTDEEIKQVRSMLNKMQKRERETIISSRKSFINWISTISGLITIADKLRTLDWEQICILISSMFN
jgi:hypothetical protein